MSWLTKPMLLGDVQQRGVGYVAMKAAAVIERRGEAAVTLQLNGSVSLENPATAEPSTIVGCYAQAGRPLEDMVYDDLLWSCEILGL